MRAIVLSAGYGTRLGALTEATPKPLLDVDGRSIIELILTHLAANGIADVAVNLHFGADQIRQRLGDGSRLGVNLSYSYEPQLLGTAGAVASAAEYLIRDGAFLVQYGDVVTDHDLGALLDDHRHRGAMVTILVHRRRGSNSVVEVDQTGRVSRFLERPSQEQLERTLSPWVNSGIAICEPEMIGLIPSERPSDLPRDVLPELVHNGCLYAAPLHGFRVAVDSPQRLDQLREAVASGRCRIPIPRR